MNWKPMQIDSHTHAALADYAVRLGKAVARNRSIYPDYLSGARVSMGMAIRYLLEQQQKHRGRAKKCRDNRAWRQTVSLVQCPDDANLDG